MKKLLALVLVLTLVLSMGVGALATPDPEPDPEPPYDMQNILLDKDIEMNDVVGELDIDGEYTLEFGTGTVKPVAGQTIPSLGNIDSVDGKFTIPLTAFNQLGVYTYNFKEAVGNTAGMTYDGRDLVLTVYVTRDGDDLIKYATIHELNANDKMVKIDSIDNEFYAGSLAITKTVTGNMGELDREFEVKIIFTKSADEVVRNKITVGEKDTDLTFEENEATVTINIKHGNTVTINNIPEGVTYEVVETDPGDGYDEPVYNWKEEENTVEIINNRNTGIDTGINLDNLPYILILVGAAVGLVAFTMKRRLSDDR